ncbi:ORF6N domain-containing protein [Steroidobacter agaridevorans]|uniref:ORF6N domain-containing protein n=1 Tax=Steroidobacter agaridevorans TaxID=2695856 RepID=UPI0013276EFD|nr:ORF6N domain-containing protein [Steroidobacter agaridevorans]GFE89080.1 hypothetical protein GCM10011488_40340 [Steroidobacter agaridevorans]
MTSKEDNTRGIGLTKNAALISVEHVAQSIFILRGQRVLLDSELAALYQVPTKRLNEQVKRNLDRFPEDFMFRLSRPEVDVLNRSQIATGSQKHRDPRYPPYAFTEHGAIMAATILNSQRAIEMSIYVVRAFVQLRDPLASNRQLAEKFAELERKVSSHDRAIVGILKTFANSCTRRSRRRGQSGLPPTSMSELALLRRLRWVSASAEHHSADFRVSPNVLSRRLPCAHSGQRQ